MGTNVENITAGREQVPSQARRVADGVELGVREGTFPPGSAIPSYRSLADIYDVSINTARRAVDPDASPELF